MFKRSDEVPVLKEQWQHSALTLLLQEQCPVTVSWAGNDERDVWMESQSYSIVVSK